MTHEQKNEIYDSVGNYWFKDGKQINEGSVGECLDLIAIMYGDESIFYAERYMLELGFTI